MLARDSLPFTQVYSKDISKNLRLWPKCESLLLYACNTTVTIKRSRTKRIPQKLKTNYLKQEKYTHLPPAE